MEIKTAILVSNIVAENYKTASVFKQYGIDFCCNGNRTIETVCETHKIDSNKLIEDLEKILIEEKDDTDYQAWSISFLTDYIYNYHHKYVEKKIPEIKEYLNKICNVHGAHNPELHEINRLFIESSNDLTLHMKKEELMLFPYFKKLDTVADKNTPISTNLFETLDSPIALLHEEHDNEGVRFRKIAELSDNYTPPSHACNTYKVTYAMLKEYEEDLHKHIHLENNILFKKVIDLEKIKNN